jgi:hypothetical protein
LDRREGVRELDLHLYTNDFARAAVDEFVRLYQGAQARTQAQAA